VCEECEVDVWGCSLGLMLSRVLRLAISAELPSLHGQPLGKSLGDCGALFSASLVFGALVVVLEPHQSQGRHIKVALMVCSMSMGWCLLYSGQWMFWAQFPDGLSGHSSKMLARVVMALIDSVLVVFTLFGVDFIADHMQGRSERALRSLMTAMGLLLGLAWEAAFDQAVSGIEEKFAADSVRNRVLLKVGMSAALCTLVLPAWRLYILPKAIAGAGEGHIKMGLEESMAEAVLSHRHTQEAAGINQHVVARSPTM